MHQQVMIAEKIAAAAAVQLAMVGNGETNTMLSSDGINWTTATPAQANNWKGITYGNSRFVAVSRGGTTRTMYSTDGGATWNGVAAAVARQWNAVAYSPSLVLFAACAIDGTNDWIQTSPDGTAWTGRAAPNGFTVNEDILWDTVNSLFVVIRHDGTDAHTVTTSADGTTWTSRSAQTGQWNGIAQGAGIIVAVGNVSGGAASDGVMTATDPTSTWTKRTAASASSWTSVAFGNSVFVAVAADGSVMSSTNGTAWTSRTAAEANEWLMVRYSAALGLFIACGDTGTHRVMTSPDGITWTARTASDGSTNFWNAVAANS